ncbi:unnamed protein product, partial [Lymnaea stagnalis]
KGKENDPRASPGTANSISSLEPSSPTGIPDFIARDYEHDRLLNHTDALKGDYGEDISKLARELLLQEAEQTDEEDHHHQLADGRAADDDRNGGLNIINGGDLPLTNNV